MDKKNRTVIQIQTDRKLNKILEDHVSKGGRRILILSLHDDDVIVSGDEDLVNIANRNKGDITINELKQQLKALGEPPQKDHGLKFIKTEVHETWPCY